MFVDQMQEHSKDLSCSLTGRSRVQCNCCSTNMQVCWSRLLQYPVVRACTSLLPHCSIAFQFQIAQRTAIKTNGR